MINPPDVVNDEPVPLTVRLPFALPARSPTLTFTALTLPPERTLSVPLPRRPIERSPLFVQVEPAPVTVTTPVLPA